jgi:flagellar hook-length control protein FliK
MNPVVPVAYAPAPSQASARAAALAAPHDLFAALLELLGALPLPSDAAGSAPQAPAQPAAAQDGLPARQESEAANALLASAAAAVADGGRPTPAPVPASDGDAAVPIRSPLPGAPALAAPRLAAAPTQAPQLDASVPADAWAPAAEALRAHAPAAPREGALDLAAANGPRVARERVPALTPRTVQAQPAQAAAVAQPPALAHAASRPDASVGNPGALAAAPLSSPPVRGSGQPRSPDPALEPVLLDGPSAEALRTEASLAGERPVASAATNPLEAPAHARSTESAQPVLASALWLSEQGGGRARIALSPRELGQVEIVVRVRGRRVEVHVHAEESAAQQVVRETRAQLSDALAARDLRMDEFTVNGGGSGASGHDSRESARDGGSQRAAALERPLGDGGARAAPGTPTVEPALPGGAIDLRV